MNWLLSLVIGLISGVAGCAIAVCIASLCVSWYRISNFEGGSGYFVAFIGLIGIIVGLVGGLICARIVAAGVAPGFLKALGVAMGSLLVLGVVILGFCRLFADLVPTIDGRPLELAIEVRTPKGFILPAVSGTYGPHAGIRLSRGQGQPYGKLRFAEAHAEHGRLIVPAVFSLQTSAAEKFIHVYFNEDNNLMFHTRLRGNPQPEDCEWSEWFEASPSPGAEGAAAENAFSLRYRVRVVPKGITPPRPNSAAVQTEQLAAEQAGINALAVAPPSTDWFKATAYGTPPERLARAVNAIASRPNLSAELSELIVSEDQKTAQGALNLFQHLPAVSADMNPVVAQFGRKIASAITAFNATTPEQDPHYQAAADISLNFSAWMVAVRALRAHDKADLTPELNTILEAARLRPDSTALRNNVVRVASYYMHEWTGLAPLATDPKPR